MSSAPLLAECSKERGGPEVTKHCLPAGLGPHLVGTMGRRMRPGGLVVVVLQLVQEAPERGLREPVDLGLVGPGHVLVNGGRLREGLVAAAPDPITSTSTTSISFRRHKVYNFLWAVERWGSSCCSKSETGPASEAMIGRFLMTHTGKMSRRRHSDEGDGGQAHKRRRTSEPTEIEDRLESLICRVGEKSTSSLESNLEGLAGVLEADLPNYKNKILRIFARTLPEKLTVYTTLVGLLNARNYNFGGEFVEAMIRQLKETLKNNFYNEALYLVRFLSDLVNCHVIAAPSMVAMFENFISVTQEDDVPQVRSDWFVHVVLSCLPWVGKELYEKKDVEMDRLLSQIEGYLKRRSKTHVPMLQVWTAEKPHPQEEYLDCLWAQIQKLKKDRWQERHILRPYIAFDSVLCEALQHNLPPFTPPGHMPDAQYPHAPRGLPHGPVMPGSHSVERLVIEENLHCIIKSHWKERKSCAAQLLSYPGKNKIPLNYHIVEVIFGELFQLPCAPHIDVMYTTLLIELCKLQPGSLPQVLAQATEMLYMRLDTMNTTCIDRLINWFSHHLSNFQFRWSWDDWADCLTLDAEKPKPKFVKEVLEKSMRLSYHQRIVDIVPAGFTALIPAEPSFHYKYEGGVCSLLPGYQTAITVGNAIKNRASNEEILTILKEMPKPNQEDDDDEGESFNPLKTEVFLQTLLHLAAKSFSHSFSALAK
ncbi:Nuclear cap-binding protein subunit 1 [Merluccius polli]|uniref:Nuclear cap-binding protein subunit 1 n=1 Tax=Merluccius polli TaxID=89951 RepID=A0AA47NV75_MERPO|nr:Nuclear cap-binding protein subunit 1 [Merluccius polli]